MRAPLPGDVAVVALGQIDTASVGTVCAILAGMLILLGWKRPDLFVRGVFWLPAHLFYRIRVHGRDHVPAEGPALLVCNHVSWIDAILVFLAQKRSVRFMAWAPFFNVPGLRWLLRFTQVIPIDGSSGPRAIVKALKEAGEALGRGEVVCIFAEGSITRTGFLLPFQRGFEQILKRSPAPVVPVFLGHVWGSIFSYQGNSFFWKWPQKLPYPVNISFGAPLPATTTALDVRQAIQVLSAENAIARRGLRRPVHCQFVRMAARHPFRPCFIDQNQNDKVYRYGEALAGAKIMAEWLRPLLGDDAMVGLWIPPSVGGALANIAIAILGKTTVNLNYTSSPAVVASAVRQTNLRHIVTSKLFVSKVKLEVEQGVELIYLEDMRKEITKWQRVRAVLAVVVLPGFVQERLLGIHRHKLRDLATVIFSSGSTGDPKGVMLSHGNLAANAESVIQGIDPRPSDRLLGILPFFHSFGYTVTLWVPLQVGASALFHADPRQAKEIGELCKKFACTLFLTTPTFLRFCLRRCEPDDFRTLRILMCGAEKLPVAFAAEFEQKFGVQPLEGYGCTELSPVVSANVPNWEKNGRRQLGNKVGTIGQPLPGIAVKIVHPESFAPVAVGEEGLLLVYGGNVMVGYLGRPEATGQAIRDGWYVTGDIAKLDEEGFVTITDRLSRFSKIGGEMVPHQKIEDELQDLLATSERVVVVTAVPDEKRGERLIVLYTNLNGTEVGPLCQKLGGRGLPNLWLPGERDFFPIPEMPVLGSGKMDLKRVKELALERTQRK